MASALLSATKKRIMLDSGGAPTSYWTRLKQLLSSNMWVGIGALAAIASIPFVAKVFENDRVNLRLYQLGWERHSFTNLTITSEKLRDVPASLAYQVEYLLLNAGNRPLETSDYVDAITVRGQDDVFVVSVASRLIDTLKPVEWKSDDGVSWKMLPEFLNPGDRLSITIFAATGQKTNG